MGLGGNVARPIEMAYRTLEEGVPIRFRTCVLMLALVLTIGTAARASADGEAAHTCDKFMKAMQSQDWSTAYGFFSKGYQKAHAYEGWSLQYTTYSAMVSIVHWKVDVTEKGDKASGKITLTSRAGTEEATHDDFVELVQEDGAWKIDSVKTK